MQNPFSSHHQQPFALTPVFTKDTLLPDSRSVRTTLRTVERLAQMARAKANGANVHSVNHTIGALRCWYYMRLHVKSRAARQAATADAIACALKLRAFIVTGQITLWASSDESMHTPFVRDSVEAKVILVVDDYKPLRVLIQRILERQHYRVLCASNGEQAIITAREHPGKIDLLLTDLTLTGMQGLDLASMLLAERSEMKVAYMSGDPTAAAIRRLTASGDPAQFILQKPFYTDMLIEMVRGMIGDPDQYNQGPTNPPGSSMAQFWNSVRFAA